MCNHEFKVHFIYNSVLWLLFISRYVHVSFLPASLSFLGIFFFSGRRTLCDQKLVTGIKIMEKMNLPLKQIIFLSHGFKQSWGCYIQEDSAKIEARE